MKNKILITLIAASLFSCTKRIARPPVKGIVVDSVTTLPMKNVSILTWNEKSEEYISEVVTNKKGEFSLPKIEYYDLLSIGAEAPAQMFQFKVSADKYNLKEIEENSRYGFSSDTIFYNIKMSLRK